MNNIDDEYDIPMLNKISILLHYVPHFVGLFLFILIIIVMRLTFGWFTPRKYWVGLGEDLKAYVNKKQSQLIDDAERLSRKT